ncbi:hypothetical protein, partial [Cohnella thailandensis]|uniref:hypothetical protein n=1 Tax=Cohnella thailandensis TaxID=557557 RepID=UPI001C883177
YFITLDVQFSRNKSNLNDSILLTRCPVTEAGITSYRIPPSLATHNVFQVVVLPMILEFVGRVRFSGARNNVP